MTVRKDFHVHTTFSDGKCSPEEMVLAAIRMGMTEIGFSDHSYTAFDESYCLQKDRIGEYRQAIGELREKYRGQIRILCGIEQDYYSDEPTDEYENVIGSVHYVKVGDEYLPVDMSAKAQKAMVEQYFNGDFYAFAETYFDTVANVVKKTGADIIGHFDLAAKFSLFDEQDPRYIRAWRKAIDALLPTGKPFEINTGAISRGYRTVPYPNPDMLEYIREKGGTFILSSDSHRADTLCFGFDRFEHWL